MVNKVVQRITRRNPLEKGVFQSKASPSDLNPQFQSKASPSDIARVNGSANQSSNLFTPASPSDLAPKKQQAPVIKKGGNAFIQAREKIASQLAEASGNARGKPSKNQKDQATKEAAIKEQQKSGEITVEEANKKLQDIQGAVGSLNDTLGANTTPTQAELEAQNRNTALDIALTVAPTAIAVGLVPLTGGGSFALASILAGLGGSVALGLTSNERQKATTINEAFLASTGVIQNRIDLARTGQISREQAIMDIRAEMEQINQQERALKILMANPISRRQARAEDEAAAIVRYKQQFGMLQQSLELALQEGTSLRMGVGIPQQTQ